MMFPQEFRPKHSPLIDELESGFGLCSGGGGDNGGGTQTTVQKSDPWSGQQPYLETGYKWAQAAAEKTPTTPYQGQLLIPATGQQRALNNQQYSLGGQISQTGQPLMDAGQATLSNIGTRVAGPANTSDISQNPYALKAIDAAVNPVMREFREQILPQIGSSAVREGAWGGTDHLRAQVLAGERAQNQASEAAAKIALPLYTAERGFETDLQKQTDALNMSMAARELQMSPQLTSQGLNQIQQGLGLQQQSAGQERNWAQETLDEEMARYQMALEAPWAAVNPYMRLIAGFDPGGTSTITAPAASRGSVAQGALGGGLAGGLGGYGAASMLGLAGGPWMWPMILGGGLLGGLSGAL